MAIRIIAAVSLLLAIALPALAQDCWMGILFETEDGLVDHIPSTPSVATAHLCAETALASIGGYEAGLAIDNPALIILSLDGPNGFINFGDATNQIVGYVTPVPVIGVTILCTLSMLATDAQEVEICVVAADPSGFDPPAPGLCDGFGNCVPCEGRCAYISEPVANETATFGTIKGLFR